MTARKGILGPQAREPSYFTCSLKVFSFVLFGLFFNVFCFV
jgi:hypothetical protein